MGENMTAEANDKQKNINISQWLDGACRNEATVLTPWGKYHLKGEW